jgi:hypothetical protein
VPNKGIREVYLKFLTGIEGENGFINEFERRELRTLTYALTYKENDKLSIFENLDYLQKCLFILDENWRDSFILGLLDCYLSNWNSAYGESFNSLSSFLIPKIENYKGSRSLLQALKDNSRFFDMNKGDLDLGATLALTRKNISEATKYLSLPDHWIALPYFAGVIYGFFEKSKKQIEIILDDISIALERHSNSIKSTRTNKLIVSKIICHSIDTNESVQNKIKDMAFKLVGDPGSNALWRSNENESQSDIATINKAREILNEWVTRQFIYVFFEKCINDNRRKLFWLKYSKNISAFKVFGPSHVKRLLKADKRIAEYVDGRFNLVDGSRDVSAFMFILGGYKMIEFSDPGYAFYAYKSSNSSAPSFDLKYISSVESLRDGSMPMLVYRSGYSIRDLSDEGRLSHHDGDMKWEDVFSIWLKRKAEINV